MAQNTGSGARGPRELGLPGSSERAQLLCTMWGLPGSGTEPVSPAMAGGFFTTELPGRPLLL